MIRLPLLVASSNGAIGFPPAWEILSGGGTALDAVEAATRDVEDNPDDHTVGYGGYPNLLGDVELDASIVEGTTRRAGAVAALRGYRHPISIAREVMDRLPHVLLAGEGAARFAAELGLETENLLTDAAAAVWRQGLEGRLPADAGVAATMLARVRELASDPERAAAALGDDSEEDAGDVDGHRAGTVNVMAIDAHGHIASAVSTSGWAWKYPGRVGDSPVIGAGNYADDRYGAAACTGWGELSIRAGTARSVVAALEAGVALEDACVRALRDLATLGVALPDVLMHLVAIDAAGNHCAVTTSRRARAYAFQAGGMTEPEVLPRISVDLA